MLLLLTSMCYGLLGGEFSGCSHFNLDIFLILWFVLSIPLFPYFNALWTTSGWVHFIILILNNSHEYFFFGLFWQYSLLISMCYGLLDCKFSDCPNLKETFVSLCCGYVLPMLFLSYFIALWIASMWVWFIVLILRHFHVIDFAVFNNAVCVYFNALWITTSGWV